MCCCAQFIVKYVLFFTNLIFSLAGIALVAIGSVTLINVNNVVEVLPEELTFIPVTIIVIGSIIFIIAFLGCCGAIKQNCCMLTTYAIFMAILAGIKIWILTVIYQNLNNLDSLVSEWITTAFNNGPNAFQAVEETFQCCGTSGALSYPGMISSTCCDEAVCTLTNSYPGCVDIVTDYLHTFGNAIGAVVIVVIIAEVVAVIFGLFLGCTSSKNKKMNYA